MSMSASAADVRSILSLPGPSSTPSQPKKPVAVSTRKPEGISRELYSLIGPSAPSLAAQLAKPRLKQKPNFGSGGKIKWEWRSFKNGARNDSLQLNHWVKASTDPSLEYSFAKYNVQSTVYTYSQDEYTRFLEDKEWTKEETDYLFNVVREYDSRWFVIHDRYGFPGGVQRTIDDLKDRYYSVCRKLVRNRSWAGDEGSKAQLMSTFQFDKDREVTRKKYILSLEDRTSEQIAEEEALYIEIKRLEQNERRFKKDRDELLRTLAGADSGLPDIAASVEEEGLAGLTIDVKKRKKGGLFDMDSPSTPPNIISLGPPVVKRMPSAKSAAHDAVHCITRTDVQLVTTPTTKATHQPASLRSFKLPTPKISVAPKIAQALAELRISYARLVMPTHDNSAQLESLLEATTALVETKKVVDKVEYDIKVLKARLGNRRNESVDIAMGEPEPTDVDEGIAGGDGEADDGRAQSVVSTRSGRSRKQTRRSVSISSVDTSATVSTRTGTKRQKRS